MRFLIALCAIVVCGAVAEAGPLRDRLKARFGPYCWHQQNGTRVYSNAVPASCICGDACACPADACPTKCPVSTPVIYFSQPVGVPTSISGCPNGKCPAPSRR